MENFRRIAAIASKFRLKLTFAATFHFVWR